MPTVSLRLNDDDYKLVQSYAYINSLNLSEFIRSAILEKIDEDYNLDEERILSALEKSKKEKVYSAEEVWKELGI